MIIIIIILAFETYNSDFWNQTCLSDSLQPHRLHSPWNSPGDLPSSEIEPRSPALQVDSFFFFAGGKLQNSLPAEPPGRDFQLNDSLYDSTF